MHKSAYKNMIAKTEELVDLFKAIAEEIRLRIIWILLKAKSELCVCEIMDALNESQYNVSRHLKILKFAGLVRERKEGKWVFYALAKPKNLIQKRLLEAIRAIPEKLFAEDRKRLEKRLSLRKDGKVVIGMRCNLKRVK